MIRLIPALLLCAAAGAAGAHSASDAYLTVSVDRGAPAHGATIHGEWDIAIRDLNFELNLDDDGDGHVTWGEVKRHLPAIERYAYGKLAFQPESGNACSIKPARRLIDAHADGAYVALFFDLDCSRAPHTLAMSYELFFAIDPSHRGIFVMHAGTDTSTAVLSPQNTQVTLVR
jgi:hypothetical protein